MPPLRDLAAAFVARSLEHFAPDATAVPSDVRSTVALSAALPLSAAAAPWLETWVAGPGGLDEANLALLAAAQLAVARRVGNVALGDASGLAPPFAGAAWTVDLGRPPTPAELLRRRTVLWRGVLLAAYLALPAVDRAVVRVLDGVTLTTPLALTTGALMLLADAPAPVQVALRRAWATSQTTGLLLYHMDPRRCGAAVAAVEALLHGASPAVVMVCHTVAALSADHDAALVALLRSAIGDRTAVLRLHSVHLGPRAVHYLRSLPMAEGGLRHLDCSYALGLGAEDRRGGSCDSSMLATPVSSSGDDSDDDSDDDGGSPRLWCDQRALMQLCAPEPVPTVHLLDVTAAGALETVSAVSSTELPKDFCSAFAAAMADGAAAGLRVLRLSDLDSPGAHALLSALLGPGAARRPVEFLSLQHVADSDATLDRLRTARREARRPTADHDPWAGTAGWCFAALPQLHTVEAVAWADRGGEALFRRAVAALPTAASLTSLDLSRNPHATAASLGSPVAALLERPSGLLCLSLREVRRCALPPPTSVAQCAGLRHLALDGVRGGAAPWLSSVVGAGGLRDLWQCTAAGCFIPPGELLALGAGASAPVHVEQAATSSPPRNSAPDCADDVATAPSSRGPVRPVSRGGTGPRCTLHVAAEVLRSSMAQRCAAAAVAAGPFTDIVPVGPRHSGLADVEP